MSPHEVEDRTVMKITSHTCIDRGLVGLLASVTHVQSGDVSIKPVAHVGGLFGGFTATVSQMRKEQTSPGCSCLRLNSILKPETPR